MYSRQLPEVMAKVQNCALEVSEFEFQLSYYVHFRINNHRKIMNFLIH